VNQHTLGDIDHDEISQWPTRQPEWDRDEQVAGKTMSIREDFNWSVYVAQQAPVLTRCSKRLSARPQRVKARGVLSGVRWGSERCENDAGGLFQQPV